LGAPFLPPQSGSPQVAIVPSALRAEDKQGRYVRIQLLDKNHLSLAEVQVIGGELILI
jgi:hypothetical protein